MIDQERIRWEAIAYILDLSRRYVAVPASLLRSFRSGGDEIFLKGPQGIFRPRQLDAALSIRTSLTSPYADELIGEQQIRYSFAKPESERTNDDLKLAGERGDPLIYLVQAKGKPNPEYHVFAPVRVAGWNDQERMFTIDLAPEVTGMMMPEAVAQGREGLAVQEVRELVKAYVTVPVARRLHQAKFREQVLRAYRERCAVCVLRVRPLLDGAHIVPDREPTPTIVVNEGLSLCATHHRAFDARILRYDDSYRVRVELPSGTRIGDGERTMLLDFNGKPLSLPSDEALWPVPA